MSLLSRFATWILRHAAEVQTPVASPKAKGTRKASPKAKATKTSTKSKSPVNARHAIALGVATKSQLRAVSADTRRAYGSIKGAKSMTWREIHAIGRRNLRKIGREAK